MKDTKKPKIRFKGFNDSWEQRKLGEFSEMFNGDRGINYPKDSDMVPEGIPFINAGDLQNGQVNLKGCNKISREKFNQLGGAKIQRGDILYCLRGTLGKNAFVDNFDEGTVASSLVDIRPKNIDGTFLFTILNSDIEYRQRTLNDEGAAQPNLSAKNLADFDIPVPSLEEQEEIGAFFATLDNTITLHQRECEKLLCFKKSMLEKMFPKNGEKYPEIRFSCFTDSWEQRKLGNAASSFDYGLNAAAIAYDGQNRYIRITDIDDSTHEFLKTDLTSPDTDLSRADNYKLSEGDILFARTGASVGKTYIYRHSDGLVYYAGFLIRARIKDNFDPEFIFQNTLTPNYDRYIRISSQRSGQPGVNAQEYSEYEMLVPSLPEQRKIGGFLRNLDNLITLHQREVDKLAKLKKSMLEKMFV